MARHEWGELLSSKIATTSHRIGPERLESLDDQRLRKDHPVARRHRHADRNCPARLVPLRHQLATPTHNTIVIAIAHMLTMVDGQLEPDEEGHVRHGTKSEQSAACR